MPSDKKRINLTVPDNVYARLQTYKEENGIASDATACLQLIVQQLNGLENTKQMFKLVKEYSADQLLALSREGFLAVKEAMAEQEAKEEKK